MTVNMDLTRVSDLLEQRWTLLRALKRAKKVLSEPNTAATEEIWDDVVREVGDAIRKCEGR